MKQQEHFVNEYQKHQVTEYTVEKECDDLFRTTPIPFRPRQGDVLDESIAQIVYNQHITIPIVNVKDSQYLIGTDKKTCMLKSGHVLVKVGGGTERFDEYVPRNHRVYQKNLVGHMIQHNQSLEWVTNELVQGNNLNVGTSMNNSPARTSPTRKSGASGFTPKSGT